MLKYRNTPAIDTGRRDAAKSGVPVHRHAAHPELQRKQVMGTPHTDAWYADRRQSYLAWEAWAGHYLGERGSRLVQAMSKHGDAASSGPLVEALHSIAPHLDSAWSPTAADKMISTTEADQRLADHLAVRYGEDVYVGLRKALKAAPVPMADKADFVKMLHSMLVCSAGRVGAPPTPRLPQVALMPGSGGGVRKSSKLYQRSAVSGELS
jgi:hypothetical protein